MAASRAHLSAGARTRQRLIDSAAGLLGAEGFPAFTARRIAAHAGVKAQLVHYYFSSMEELVVTVYHRSAATYFRAHDEALSSDRPLHALWDLNSRQPEAKLVFEFVALAKHYPLLRDEMRKSGEAFRILQIEAIEAVYARRSLTEPQMSAGALAALMIAVARNLIMEEQVGLAMAHAETRAVIEGMIARLED